MSQNAKRAYARKDTGLLLDRSLFPEQLFHFWIMKVYKEQYKGRLGDLDKVVSGPSPSHSPSILRRNEGLYEKFYFLSHVVSRGGRPGGLNNVRQRNSSSKLKIFGL